MTALLPVLTMLACPIGMGLIIWLMMRGQHDESSSLVAGTDTHTLPPSPQLTGQFTFAGLCLNWKVIGGLAAVGGIVWLVAPQVIGLALPFLILLACPLSMILMMRGVRHSQSAAPNEQASSYMSDAPDVRAHRLAALYAQQKTIAREILLLESIGESLQSDGVTGKHISVEESAQRT